MDDIDCWFSCINFNSVDVWCGKYEFSKPETHFLVSGGTPYRNFSIWKKTKPIWLIRHLLLWRTSTTKTQSNHRQGVASRRGCNRSGFWIPLSFLFASRQLNVVQYYLHTSFLSIFWMFFSVFWGERDHPWIVCSMLCVSVLYVCVSERRVCVGGVWRRRSGWERMETKRDDVPLPSRLTTGCRSTKYVQSLYTLQYLMDWLQ